MNVPTSGVASYDWKVVYQFVVPADFADTGLFAELAAQPGSQTKVEIGNLVTGDAYFTPLVGGWRDGVGLKCNPGDTIRIYVIGEGAFTLILKTLPEAPTLTLSTEMPSINGWQNYGFLTFDIEVSFEYFFDAGFPLSFDEILKGLIDEDPFYWNDLNDYTINRFELFQADMIPAYTISDDRRTISVAIQSTREDMRFVTVPTCLIFEAPPGMIFPNAESEPSEEICFACGVGQCGPLCC